MRVVYRWLLRLLAIFKRLSPLLCGFATSRHRTALVRLIYIDTHIIIYKIHAKALSDNLQIVAELYRGYVAPAFTCRQVPDRRPRPDQNTF